jgi:hypothetical protein
MRISICLLGFLFFVDCAAAKSQLPECGISTWFFAKRDNCYDSFEGVAGSIGSGERYRYEGEWKDDDFNGQGSIAFYTQSDDRSKKFTEKYEGQFLRGKYHGVGKFTQFGIPKSTIHGIWEDGKLVRCEAVDMPSGYEFSGEFAICNARRKQQVAPDGREIASKPPAHLRDANRPDEQRPAYKEREMSRLRLQIDHAEPSVDGSFIINIQTNTDTASLKINNEEQGGSPDGRYTVKKFARAGKETQFTVVATDINGNAETKSITVSRAIVDSSPRFASLDPLRVRARPTNDAVAIIIGIQNYRRAPKAEFASDDARAFYDYAIRALGVKRENIKLLIDEQADEVEILAALKNWLPVKVNKAKTDVYLFYSGHGLPSDDGKNLYILPYGADKQFLDKTALNQQEIVTALKAIQAKSVTLFMDACYSGQIRTGDTLLASARPVALRTSADNFPSDFTVFTASSPDQIASSSPELRHGIFSYYLMKGMEGDADENKDGRITVSELQNYVSEMVGRQALTLSRRQEPQLVGDSSRTIVAK